MSTVSFISPTGELTALSQIPLRRKGKRGKGKKRKRGKGCDKDTRKNKFLVTSSRLAAAAADADAADNVAMLLVYMSFDIL